MSDPADPLAVVHRPVRAQSVGNLLIKEGDGLLQRRQKIGVGRTGTRQPRCSGFLTRQKTPVSVRVCYVHDEGDDESTSTRLEAERHGRIREILQADGYTAEIPDSPVPGDVGVHVRRLTRPADPEWDALRSIADGQVIYCHGGPIEGFDRDIVNTLILSLLATSSRHSAGPGRTYIRLTQSGENLLAHRFTHAREPQATQLLEDGAR
ncbi:hypothetical protein ACWD0J_21140 [Streptomyces sp. NPDC003011]